MNHEARFLSSTEAARRLRCTVQSIRNYCERGLLAYTRLDGGRGTRAILADSVEDFARKGLKGRKRLGGRK